MMYSFVYICNIHEAQYCTLKLLQTLEIWKMFTAKPEVL